MALDFSGARSKVDRALEHLQTLDAHIQQTIASEPQPIGAHYEPEIESISLYAIGIDFPVMGWGVRIGDCLHNLRSALDHIAWQLALDYLEREPTEAEAKAIQFPIEDTADRFERARVRPYVGRTLRSVEDVPTVLR